MLDRVLDFILKSQRAERVEHYGQAENRKADETPIEKYQGLYYGDRVVLLSALHVVAQDP